MACGDRGKCELSFSCKLVVVVLGFLRTRSKHDCLRVSFQDFDAETGRFFLIASSLLGAMVARLFGKKMKINDDVCRDYVLWILACRAISGYDASWIRR